MARRMAAAVAMVLVLATAAGAQVLMGIDGPTGDVTSPVSFCGFAVDLGSLPRAGIASVTAYFYTPTGTVVVPAFMGVSRPDIAATYKVVQDANLGWCLPPTAVPDGVTVMTVRAVGTRPGPTGQPLGAQRDWDFTVNGRLFTWMNFPKQGQAVTPTFAVAGVARDMATGGQPRWVRLLTVDRATPDYLPLIRGYAATGQPRPGTPWDGYGWDAVLTLPSGTYDLIAETTMWSGEVESRVVRITVP